MIKNFSDHSANLLAWVRTSIAVMAFCFLIEKFDLFLKVAAPSLAQRMSLLPSHKLGSVAGLMFVVLGLAMIA
jgi:putative membrane protein